jgi:hypothetical protein
MLFDADFSPKKSFWGESLSMARNDKVQTGLGTSMWMTRLVGVIAFSLCRVAVVADFSPTKFS